MSTLLHPNCPDDPCVDCTDCFIIESGCYVKWFCVASTVQVFGPNGNLRSTDPAGQIFRPSYGRWELWACNGIGCTPTLVASTEVENWQEADCVQSCCATDDTLRNQVVSSRSHDIFLEAADRDYRGQVPNQGAVGLYIDYVRLRERLVPTFDVTGTYAYAVESPFCAADNETIIGTSTLVSEGYAEGFRSRFDFSSQTIVGCPVEVTTYATLQVDIVAKILGQFVEFYMRPKGNIVGSYFAKDGSITPNVPPTCRDGYFQEYEEELISPNDILMVSRTGSEPNESDNCDISFPLRWSNNYSLPARFLFFWIDPFNQRTIQQFFEETINGNARLDPPVFVEGSLTRDFI